MTAARGLSAAARRRTGWLNRLLLFRLANTRLDAMATAATALLVFVSRFAYLANGPWEWDETLFARGILHFELAAHFPHPPGFPGWLAIGHVLTPLVGEPLLALQVASASFSVAALWALTALGRKVAPPPVAVAAAVLVLAAPGPWLYAVRGFSSTAASTLALGAAAVAAGGLGGRRATAFTLLVVASVLVRPNLVPVLAVLWLGVAWRVRPILRLVPGVLAGSVAIIVSVAVMVRAEGGWSAFVAPFLAHSQRHFSRLAGNLGGYGDLGLVKGLGGVAPASLLLILATVGVFVWARRVGRRQALLWVVVLAVAISQLMWMQNRTTGRYAVGVQMALAPLVAGAAATLPPAAGCAGLLAVAGWLGTGSQPLVVEQHTKQLPAWRAVIGARQLALATDRSVVVESELHPFASYLWHLARWRGEPVPPKVLSPWDPEPWAGMDERWLVVTVHRHFYPDGLFGREQFWGGVSDSLFPLTQQRFLEAWLIEDPPLPLHGWWPRERTGEGRPFMWGGADAKLLLPPLAEGSELSVAVRPAPGPDPMVLVIDGESILSAGGGAAEARNRIVVRSEMSEGPSLLEVRRRRGYSPGPHDQRRLALQLFEFRAIDAVSPWVCDLSHPWDRESVSVELDGVYETERFPGFGDGVWTGPRARLGLPGARGTVRLRLWAPRPTPPRTVIWIGKRQVSGQLEITPVPIELEFKVLAEDVVAGRVDVEIVSDPYSPTERGGDDDRSLGVVVSKVAFDPIKPAS